MQLKPHGLRIYSHWGLALCRGQSIITIKLEHRISIFLLIGVLLDYLEEMYFRAMIMIRIG